MSNHRSSGNERVHRAVSADGTEIVGRVQGQGPPLVLLPAGPADSATTWEPLLAALGDRFTCYLLDTRGRGLSADHPDRRPERLAEDVTSFVESIGEPVGLVSWGDLVWAHVAAQDHAPVAAVAAYEPVVPEAASEPDAAAVAELFGRVGQLAAEGRLADAARALVEGAGAIGVYTATDLASATDLWSASASNIPLFLQELEQAGESEMPSPTDPTVLARVAVPVLLLHGSGSHPWLRDGVEHVAAHVADPRVREIDGAGHFGPYTHPDAVADEVTRFLTAAHV